MNLSYKNFSTNEILNQVRNIKYAMATQLYNLGNIIEIEISLIVNLIHISHQADVFAREILVNRSKFDLKRFLGPDDQEWLKLLHLAYVYDRLKCLYYGMNSNNIFSFPDNSVSFPGNLLMMNILKRRRFQYSTTDAQPFSLFVNVTSERDFEVAAASVFEFYPELKEGLSDYDNNYSYMNSKYESILRGLYNAKLYMDTAPGRNASNSSLFDMKMMNDDSIDAFLVEDSCPLLNSFLNEGFDRFYFIFPTEQSGPLKMHFNESLFVSRAMGMTSIQLEVSGNALYKVADRSLSGDVYAKDDVYSITGLKSEIVPYSDRLIIEYLGLKDRVTIDPEGTFNFGGNNINTP